MKKPPASNDASHRNLLGPIIPGSPLHRLLTMVAAAFARRLKATNDAKSETIVEENKLDSEREAHHE
jgi:hypothetical protein